MKILHIPPRPDEHFLAIQLRGLPNADAAIKVARSLNFEPELAHLIHVQTNPQETDFVLNLPIEGLNEDELNARIDVLAESIPGDNIIHIRSWTIDAQEWNRIWLYLKDKWDNRKQCTLSQVDTLTAAEFKLWSLLMESKLSKLRSFLDSRIRK